MSRATDNFCNTAQVGQGGYGKVYRGTLGDGTVVAIKRAQEGSLQGEKEFLTEIELLSRLHHRNLVSLLGYCDEEGEQVFTFNLLFEIFAYKNSIIVLEKNKTALLFEFLFEEIFELMTLFFFSLAYSYAVCLMQYHALCLFNDMLQVVFWGLFVA